jgi:hypothetical protein
LTPYAPQHYRPRCLEPLDFLSLFPILWAGLCEALATEDTRGRTAS